MTLIDGTKPEHQALFNLSPFFVIKLNSSYIFTCCAHAPLSGDE